MSGMIQYVYLRWKVQGIPIRNNLERFLSMNMAQSYILCKLKTVHIENIDHYDETGQNKCRSYLHFTTILFQCQEGLAPIETGTRAALLGQTISIEDDQLGIDAAPVLTPTGPFLRDILHRKVKQLEQAVIGRKYRTCFGHLPKLSVEALDSIRRIYQFP